MKLPFFSTIILLFACCAEIPKHTNPFDPLTEYDAPTKVTLEANFNIDEIAEEMVEFSWDAVEDQNFYQYEIWRSDSVNGRFKLIAVNEAAYSNSYRDRGLISSTDYYYKIIVVDKRARRAESGIMRLRTAVRSRPNRINLPIDAALEDISLYRQGTSAILYYQFTDSEGSRFLGKQQYYLDSLKPVINPMMDNLQINETLLDSFVIKSVLQINSLVTPTDSVAVAIEYSGFGNDTVQNCYLGFIAQIDSIRKVTNPPPPKTTTRTGLIKFKKGNSEKMSDYSIDNSWKLSMPTDAILDDFMINKMMIVVLAGGPKGGAYQFDPSGTLIDQNNKVFSSSDVRVNGGTTLNNKQNFFIINTDNDMVQPFQFTTDIPLKPILISELKGNVLVDELVDMVQDTAGVFYLLDKGNKRILVVAAPIENPQYLSEWTIKTDVDDDSRLIYDGGENIFLISNDNLELFNLVNRQAIRRPVE